MIDVGSVFLHFFSRIQAAYMKSLEGGWPPHPCLCCTHQCACTHTPVCSHMHALALWLTPFIQHSSTLRLPCVLPERKDNFQVNTPTYLCNLPHMHLSHTCSPWSHTCAIIMTDGAKITHTYATFLTCTYPHAWSHWSHTCAFVFFIVIVLYSNLINQS